MSINISSIEIDEGTPLPISRRVGSTSKLMELLLDLEPGQFLKIPSGDNEQHKMAQRSVNLIMKKLHTPHPEYNFVTRTLSHNDEGWLLGVYRLADDYSDE